MDWPVIGAISGVSVLAIAVTVGAVAMVRSAPEPPKRATIAMAPLLRFEPRPEVGILTGGPQLASLNPADYGASTPRGQPKASSQASAPPQASAPQASPARRTPPPEAVARPVAP